MNKNFLFLFALIILFSCSTSKQMSGGNQNAPDVSQTLLDDNTFKISEYSDDKSYGYTEKNPIKVGGSMREGPKNERRFLNALSGPNGETLEYVRLGSCCAFQTKNSEFGGLLDKYSVTYEGLKENLIIYINMYDSDTLKVPLGLKLKD
jgi:hypothetical protein